MPIAVTCPKCAATGHLPDEAVGTRVACPVCQTVFDQPGQPGSARPDSSADLGVWVDPLAGPPTPAAAPPAPAVAAPAEPPTPDDPAGLLDWVRQEKARFDVYVRQRLTDMEGTRRRLADVESQAEARAVTREMELNRRQGNGAARA